MNKFLLLALVGLACLLFAANPAPAPTPLLLPVQNPNTGKWGYINEQGRLAIPAKFDLAYPFSEGLADVGREDGNRSFQHGFIDSKGNTVIPCIYQVAVDFDHGQSVVELGGRWGIIDKTGRFLLYPQYKDLSGFSEGLALAASQTLTGYLDEKGRFRIPEQFEDARDFSGGLAAVSRDGQYGYIDHRGRTVIGFRFQDAENFSEGLAAASDEHDKWGYIDRGGQWAVPPRYDMAYGFDQGIAEVNLNKKFFFIGKGGKPLLPGTYEDLYYYSEGLAAAKDKGLWGFIDRAGRWVIAPQYREAQSFNHGWARVTDDSGLSYYLSPSGQTLAYNPGFQWDGGLAVYLLVLLLPALLSHLACHRDKKTLPALPRGEAVQAYYRLGLNLNAYYLAYIFWFFAGVSLAGETDNYQLLCGKLWRLFHGLASRPRIHDSLYNMAWSLGIALLFTLGTLLTRSAAFQIDRTLRGTTWTFPLYLKRVLAFQALAIGPMILWFGISPFFRVGSPAYYLVLGLFLLSLYALSPFFLRTLTRAHPLANPALEEAVARLCEKAGIKVRAVLVMPTRTSKVANAMVSGLFPFFRYIFFTDYLIGEFTAEEAETVLAHEIGHIKKGHPWYYVGLTFLYLLATKPAVEAAYPLFQSSGVTIVIFLLAWFYLFYGVIVKFVSRAFERQADDYCVQLTGKKEAYVTALNKLAELNFSTRKWGVLDRLLKTHPDIATRVERVRKM